MVLQKFVGPLFEFISITDRIAEKTTIYIGQPYVGQMLNINGIIVNFITYILYPLIAIKFLRHKFDLVFNYEFLIILIFFVCVLEINIALFYRYFNYFIFFEIILLAEFGGKLYEYLSSSFSVRFPLFFVSFAFSVLIFIQIRNYYFNPIEAGSNLKEYSRYYPYSSVLSKEINEDRERLFIYYTY
jgi:hypothetical protein